MPVEPAELVNLDRYPVLAPRAPEAAECIAGLRRSLAGKGVAILPEFLKSEALAAIVDEVTALRPEAHHEDVAVGTPYLELPDESFPEGHPRRTSVRSATDVIPYDKIPLSSALRALYEWDRLMDFVGEVLERAPLYRFADPLGALNMAAMDAGDVQGWHYDSTDFVVSLALQASTGGGLFECAPRIRSRDDENYAAVARVLAGDPGGIEVFPMTPGTLMIFEGRHSLHRVSPVEGDVPRYVALMGFDTAPGTDASDLLKLVRYGRTEASPPPP